MPYYPPPPVGGPAGAPTDATYITQTPSAGLSAEQALSTLGAGLLKNTAGVLSTAVPGVDYLLAGSLGGVFPVGFVFISVDPTNPAASLGFGTWVAFGTGRVLVGVDITQSEFDTVEETGGAKTHVLTTAQMPSHTHVQNAHAHTITDPGHVHALLGGVLDDTTAPLLGPDASTSNATTFTDGMVAATTGIIINNTTAVNQNTGSDGAHNNLQPYITVWMFKRIL